MAGGAEEKRHTQWRLQRTDYKRRIADLFYTSRTSLYYRFSYPKLTVIAEESFNPQLSTFLQRR